MQFIEVCLTLKHDFLEPIVNVMLANLNFFLWQGLHQSYEDWLIHQSQVIGTTENMKHLIFLLVSIGLGSMFLCFFSFLDPFSSGQPACPSLDSGCRPGNRKDAGDLRKVYGDFNFVKTHVKHIFLCQNVHSFRRIWGQFRIFFNQPPALVLIFSLGWDPWQETLHTDKVHSGAQETETRRKWCNWVRPSQSREQHRKGKYLQSRVP